MSSPVGATGSAGSDLAVTSLAETLGATGGLAGTDMGEGTGTVGPLAVSEGDALSPSQSSMWTLAFLFTIPRVLNVDGRVPNLTRSNMVFVNFEYYEFEQRFRTVPNTK